jgi:protease-4
VALIDVKGIIMPDEAANADDIVRSLRKAFEAEQSQSIVLRINSPGGSPVQSGMIYREILRLRKENPDKKVYAVITDVGASGAYYIAAAANEIYADPASLVGSIGVISDGFGFTHAMEKLGVERRVFTAGENKAMLDPFSPLQEEQKAFFERLLSNVHAQFVTAVKEGRGDRIKDESIIFSGLVWSGQQALELGIIDGLASPGSLARDILEIDNVVDYSPKGSPFKDLFRRFGVSLGQGAVQALTSQTLQLR